MGVAASSECRVWADERLVKGVFAPKYFRRTPGSKIRSINPGGFRGLRPRSTKLMLDYILIFLNLSFGIYLKPLWNAQSAILRNKIFHRVNLGIVIWNFDWSGVSVHEFLWPFYGELQIQAHIHWLPYRETTHIRTEYDPNNNVTLTTRRRKPAPDRWRM